VSGVQQGATILVLAKAPVAGQAKTRLTPPYTPEEAAELAAAALVDTLDAVVRAPAARRGLVLDGEPGPWLPAGFEVVPQGPGGLDARIAAAFAASTGPALLIGMDTPQVTPALLDISWDDAYDAWLGPAVDGGWWALGLREPDAQLILGVPMSTSWTGAATRARLTGAGLRVGDLPMLRDVDDAVAASAVAREAPSTRFAGRLEKLCAAVSTR
jgi:glycosyltransferase A (GT-A) superfamily protein (DUF2064 family)